MNQITLTGFSNTDTKWQAYDNQVTPVPEPSTYGALLLAAAGGLLAWRRRRQQLRSQFVVFQKVEPALRAG